MALQPPRLVDRLRQGLASAVLSAAALAAPTAEAAVAPSPAPNAPQNAVPKGSPATKAKPQRLSKPAAGPAVCGAHEGGCGPSR